MVASISVYTAVQKILNDYQVRKKALSQPVEEPDPYDKAPPRNIRNFRQQTTDTLADAPQTARDTGQLTRGKTRLNIISALTSNDLVDFFRFTVTDPGKAGISVTTDKGIHIQLLDKSGKIIADSEERIGSKAENFEAWGHGKLQLDKSSYLIKVTRSTGLSRSEKPNYAIQLSMSRYFEKDYDTVEAPAAKYTAGPVNLRAGTDSAVSQVLDTFNGGNLFDTLI